MKKRQSHHGGTVFICTRIFRGFTIHDSSFPIPDSTSKAAFFGFFFVTDEGVTDGDFESAFTAKHGTSKVGVLESQGVLMGDYAG